MVKKILCLVIAIMLMLTCVGCSTVPAVEGNNGDSVFIRIETGTMNGYYYNVVYHRATKVMYMVSQHGDATVMLDADGNPLLWEG